MENNSDERIEKTKLMDTGSWACLIFGFWVGVLVVGGTGSWCLGGAAWFTLFFILDALSDIADYQIKTIEELRKLNKDK